MPGHVKPVGKIYGILDDRGTRIGIEWGDSQGRGKKAVRGIFLLIGCLAIGVTWNVSGTQDFAGIAATVWCDGYSFRRSRNDAGTKACQKKSQLNIKTSKEFEMRES